jgi:DNA-binding NarL/FixJ family response regulator
VEPVRILLVDDHVLVRAGIRALLDRIIGVEVVAEAGDGREALQLIEDFHPAIVLLNMKSSIGSSVVVLKEIVKRFPAVRVIVLAQQEDEARAMRALHAGAAGYLPKSAQATELTEAIETVARGETYISSGVSSKTLARYFAGTSGELGKLRRVLTPRQLDVLIFIAEGTSTRQIASTLNISVKTVESHRANLMDRLDIHDVAGLVRYAIKAGLIKIA